MHLLQTAEIIITVTECYVACQAFSLFYRFLSNSFNWF